MKEVRQRKTQDLSYMWNLREKNTQVHRYGEMIGGCGRGVEWE